MLKYLVAVTMIMMVVAPASAATKHKNGDEYTACIFGHAALALIDPKFRNGAEDLADKAYGFAFKKCRKVPRSSSNEDGDGGDDFFYHTISKLVEPLKPTNSF